MDLSQRFAELVVEHSRLVIAVLVVSSLVIGSGITAVDRSTGLAKYQTDTEGRATQDYINQNFTTRGENATQAVVVIRGGNVFDKQALLEQIELQQKLRANQTVNGSLASRPAGIVNVIATTGILVERGTALRDDAQAFNETLEPLADRLNRTRELQHEYYLLNRSYEQGDINETTYQERSEELQGELNRTMYPRDENLSAEQRRAFYETARQVRDLQRQADELERALQQGEIDQSTYLDRASELEKEGRTIGMEMAKNVYPERYNDLRDRETKLRDLQESLTGLSTDTSALPPLSEQRDQLASMNQSQIDSAVERVLGPDVKDDRPFAFMPKRYTPGNTTANATMMIVPTESDGQFIPGTATPEIIETHSVINDIVETHYADAPNSAFVFGNGVLNKEMENSVSDTLVILLPLSFLYVLVVLMLLYRDVVDIAIGLFGIALVLVWTVGFMGWAGFELSMATMAIPILLVGLAIDYSNHVFMRYREGRTGHIDAGDGGVRSSMTFGLAGLLVALLWVTVTTAIGFSASYFSPVEPLQQFGIIAPVGIVSAFLIFGTIVPALKVEADEFLEGRGFDRLRSPIGTEGQRLRSVLMIGVNLAERAPARVVFLAFLLATAGVVGATQLESEFEQDDFIAEDPGPWMDALPEPLAPADYDTRDKFDYVYSTFIHRDTQTVFLVSGNVTDPGTLDRTDRAANTAIEHGVVANTTRGEPAITSPLTVMETVATHNESFNRSYRAADTDGNGIPDTNVTLLYDELFEVAPELAGSVLSRDGDSYRAMRMTITSQGDVSPGDTTAVMRDAKTELEGDDVSVSLTGQPVMFTQVQQLIFETAIKSFLYSFLLIAGILLVGYRVLHGSGSLGLVTFFPIVLTLAWILGSMYLLEIPLNVMTTMIVSITLGLGVDYTIHVSERFSEEFDGPDTFSTALEKSVIGTGGALLASMLTTAGGFAILAFGFLPPMAQFGIVSALTVFYSFLASVFVLPSTLVLWYVLPRVIRNRLGLETSSKTQQTS